MRPEAAAGLSDMPLPDPMQSPPWATCAAATSRQNTRLLETVGDRPGPLVFRSLRILLWFRSDMSMETKVLEAQASRAGAVNSVKREESSYNF